jgi:TolB-like protein
MPVNSFIANLKRLLEDNANDNPYVRSIAGKGYRFDDLGHEETARETFATPPQQKLGAMLGVAAAAIVVTTLAVWGLHFSHSANANSASSNPSQVAVLPFRSLSGAPDDNKFDNDLTDAVIGVLTKGSALHVVPVAAVQKYISSGATDPMTVGRELGAEMIVIGMAQRLAGQVRVNVQLVNAEDGNQIWAGAFDGAANDLPGLSVKISDKIAKRMPSQASAEQQ